MTDILLTTFSNKLFALLDRKYFYSDSDSTDITNKAKPLLKLKGMYE